MSNVDLDKAYISPFDRFLYEFDVTHPKSESQLKEIQKFARIFALRDEVQPEGNADKIWTGF